MTDTQTPRGTQPDAGTARRPWWKHPLVPVALVVVVGAVVYGGSVWVAAESPTAPAALEVDAPDRVDVEQSFEVTATASDDDGAPVSGVPLSLAADPSLVSQPDNTVRTGDDGTATFSGLEVAEGGTYTLTVSADGSTEEVRTEAVEAAELGLTAPSEVAVNEAFTVDVSFSSRGEPVEGQELTVYVEPDGPWQTVNTGTDGTAEAVFAEGVAQPGEYTLLVNDPDAATEAKQTLSVTAEERGD